MLPSVDIPEYGFGGKRKILYADSYADLVTTDIANPLRGG